MFFGPFMAISSHFSSHCALIFSWLVCGVFLFVCLWMKGAVNGFSLLKLPLWLMCS